MKFSTGLLVVIVSMVFFYLRIAWLRGRKKRFERDYALKRRRVNGRSKGAALPQKAPGTPPYGITNWFFVAIAFIIIIFGMLMYNKMTILGYDLIKDVELVAKYAEFWYIPVALGVVIFAFCFKIDKPILDD
ncbi:MAG: Uncharacterized protein FD147_587 [Chloroflexi bacterium]|nr:MAG: Uncharacterized protein FD147_587 [Chloroflexota bacterium]MBA4376406.1 hypothetical protein [Anaerolinea sp.]